jgi:sugar phosphate isomerase/epimerase
MSVNGCNDYTPYGEVSQRSWFFRTIGLGHGIEEWRGILRALHSVGYDHVISIEHEDPLMAPGEGLREAVANLKAALVAG